MKRNLALSILFLMMAVPSKADHLDDFVNNQMQQQGITGVVIVVLHDGAVEEQRAYGLANIEFNVPMKVENVFPIASITKLFTATAIFELVQDGKISLDDKISSIVPGLPALWNDVTVLHCLNHTSGLPDLYEEGHHLLPIAFTPAEATQKLGVKPLVFKPGEKTRYNQTEYLLLQMVIEKVSGKPLQEFMAERIFQPLGMKTAQFADARDVIPGKVPLYGHLSPDTSRLGYEERNGIPLAVEHSKWVVPYLYPSSMRGAAGLVMSATDLARFDAALTAKTLLSPRTLEMMWAPTKLVNGEIGEFTGGWQHWERWGEWVPPLVGHGGGSGVEYVRTIDGHYSIILFTDCPDTLTHAMTLSMLYFYLGPTLVARLAISN